MAEKDKVTELELGSIKIEMSADDGDTIKKVIANRVAIESLMDECYSIGIEEKKLKDKLASKRIELKEMLNPLTITKIIVEDFTMSNFPSKRFGGWKDEEALLKLIPENLRGLQTMSPNRDKIEALVKAKEIPKEALELRKFNTIKGIRFTPKGEGFTPATD
ncbi:hypothetical protein KAU33_04325 [Candidatus Dependentiae bacterium]|nr:hypothetical protein [Candidatus Dependentiae bacterium]